MCCVVRDRINMTQGVSNTIEEPKQETQPIKWNGTHIKFDDEGNTEVVMKVEQPVSPKSNNKEDEANKENIENEEEDSENIVESKANETVMWEYREKQKVVWSGTHVIFKEDEEDEEEKEPVLESDEDVSKLVADISTLTTEQKSQLV